MDVGFLYVVLGLDYFVILSNTCNVQLRTGWCCKCVLHVSIQGLIVIINAYMNLKDMWLICCCM